MSMRSRVRLACTLGVTALVAAGCAGQGTAGGADGGSAPAAPGHQRLVIQNLSISATDWPAYIANQEGIFAKHDLDVAYINLVSAPAATTALVSGSYDAANISLSNVAPLLKQGQDFKLIVQTWTMAQVVMASKNAPSTTLADAMPLDHSTPVGAVSLTGEGSLVWDFLQSGYGGRPSDLDLQVDASGAGLISGAVDYGIVNPNTACVLEQQGARPVLNTGDPGDTSSYPQAVQPLFGLHTNGYWATGSWVKDHPQAAADLRDSITEAIAWMKANPAETAAVLRKSDFNLPTLSDAQFTSCVEGIVPTFDSSFPADNLTAWNTFLRTTGKIDKDLPALSSFAVAGLAGE